MEEIIEQLREANEPVPVPLELPDEDQIVEIEEQLFIDIPFVFREFLLTVSDVVYGSLEPVTVTDPQSHTYLPDVAANAWDSGVPRDLIPLCHPIALTKVSVEFEIDAERNAVHCLAIAECFGRTGVEMEALTAVQVGLLTIYDMCKAVDRGMVMTNVRVLEKHGGKSGGWSAELDK